MYPKIKFLYLTITEFIGHLHPTLVHLPIGMLVLACMFLFLSVQEKYKSLRPAVSLILFWGMICAIASCITGYVLSGTEDYESGLIQWHQWMGISVAVFSIVIYMLNKKSKRAWQVPAALLLGTMLLITGHLGGSLTHGADYLTAPLTNATADSVAPAMIRKPIPDIQQAHAYADLIEPIFEAKCYACHSSTKQKGKLRLDQPALILKGGKNGAAIVPGQTEESELIKRILLPREEEHHMPPREKPQLTTNETEILSWWVSSGADFSKKINEIPQTEKIKALLQGMENKPGNLTHADIAPEGKVEPADAKAILQLKGRGVVILPLAQGSNWLAVNFITAPAFGNPDMSLLLPVRKQLAWMKIGHTAIGDSALMVIAQCTNLTSLQLEHTLITDKGLEYLLTLENLQTLNLVGTKISSAGILKLASLKKLQTIYLYQTNINKSEWPALMKAFPNTLLDSGGYRIPFLKTDTERVKKPTVLY